MSPRMLKLGELASICNPSMLRRLGKKGAGDPQPARLAYVVSSRPMRNSISKKENK